MPILNKFYQNGFSGRDLLIHEECEEIVYIIESDSREVCEIIHLMGLRKQRYPAF